MQAHDSTDIEEGVTADLDENGHIIGLEVLDASEPLTPDELGAVKYERLRHLHKKPQPTRRRLAKPLKTR